MPNQPHLIYHSMKYRLLIIDDTQSIHNDFRDIFSTTISATQEKKLEKILFDENQPHNSEQNNNLIMIDSAYSGAEGIALVEKSLAERNPYSVAIIDVRMPGELDGVETTEKIFAIDENIQIILCTAYTDYRWEEMLDLLQNGDRWVILKKPFDAAEVRQMAMSLSQKWFLLKSMKEQIVHQTQKLETQVTELKNAQDEMYHLAYYDALTQLPNRAFFKELLKQNIRESERNKTYTGLLILDLDDFKKINDVYGHEVGDELLKIISKQLHEFTRSSDVIGRSTEYDKADDLHIHHDINNNIITISRFGGDEFNIIFRNFLKTRDIVKMASRILYHISNQSYSIQNHKLTTTVSMGISICPIDSNDPETLLKNADIALYHAKKLGKNAIALYNQELSEELIKRNKIEQGIIEGLKNNEFYLEYQPKISIQHDKIIGCEALIRWNHPILGMLSPADFLDIAEETSLIVEIDKYVLDCACQKIQEWTQLKEFKNMIISVNLSARFFQEKDIVTIIKDTIVKYAINPKNLEIELTESYLVKARKKVSQCIKELRKVFGTGIHVSIDDFGIGYSSLNYLHEFPVDTLKIDRSFIQGMNKDNNAKSIVNSVINLSHSLNHHVIAEGVETKEQYELLKEMHCDEIQGFYISKPISADKWVEYVRCGILKHPDHVR